MNENHSAQEIIKKLVEFMKKTNEMLMDLNIKVNNQSVDIEKLKKEIRKPVNRIIT